MSLLETVERWHIRNDTVGIHTCAVWLYRCRDPESNAELTQLLQTHTPTSDTFEQALLHTATDNFGDLARWCARTIDRLPHAATPDPSGWLPQLTASLRHQSTRIMGLADLSTQMYRIALADMTLLTCSPDALATNETHIRQYRAVRVDLVAQAAARN